MIKNNSSKKSDSFTRDDYDQLHHQVLGKHIRLKALTGMICHLEHLIKKQPTHKNDIIGIELFLSTLNTSMNDENKQPEQKITETQNKKKSNKLKAKKSKASKIKKQIKKIGNGSLKRTETGSLFFIFFLIFFVTNFDLLPSDAQKTTNSDVELKSKYLIQNLRGDTIDTHLSWRLVDGATLNVNILNADKFPEQFDVIKNALLSKSTLEIDDSYLHKGPKGTTSTYYEGWKGALDAASKKDTELYIPRNFEILQSKNGVGEILVELSSYMNADGYSGFTRTIADSTQSQILKSYITLYDVDTLSKNQLETIFLHEFGHAMGLAHSTAPEDLMYPTITTAYPYISQCDIDAIVSLYDGTESSQIICEK